MTAQNDNSIYLYHIKMQNGVDLFLTSANFSILHKRKEYLPYSGISYVQGQFNDSAENYIILHGIFEARGVDKEHNLAGAKIKIMLYVEGSGEDLVTYICTEHIKNDLDFKIKCQPESFKYEQTLLHSFSKTCRADFGDKKCQVDLKKYKVQTNISSVQDNILQCDIKNFDDGYFSGGKIFVINKENKELQFKIVSHTGNIIEVDNSNRYDFTHQKNITLQPGCNKSFRSCCYYFNNAVNFRGEPDIPEYNIIKN